MIDVLFVFSALAFAGLIIITGYHLVRRSGRAKGFAFYALAAFIVFIVSGAVAGPSTTNESNDKMAINQGYSGQGTTKQEELDLSQQENQNPSTVNRVANSNDKNDQPVSNAAVNGTLKVHFIDVGQADSILIQLPSGQNMLIDAGNNGDGDLVVSYLKSNGVKKLDHVIGTHPHEDHIGGLDVAIKSFDVGKVYLPRVSHTTKTYEDLFLAIKDKGLKITEARGGVKVDAGQGITAELLAPNGTGYEDLNNYSAVLKLSYGKTGFLFTGDAEELSESQMLRAGYNLKADVLKVGHHGSASSTSAAFLKEVSPQYAVICVGKDNDYGHPHAETLSRLATAGVQVFRTDQQGTIIATSDGETITFNTKPTLPVARETNTNPGVTNAQSPTSNSALPSSNTPDKQPAAAVSPASGVVIQNIDLGAELVIIKNNSGAAVDISSWKLVSEKGNQEFTFPAGTALAPGGTLTIATGPDATAGQGVLVWTRKNIWNNDGDPGALYDSDGKLVSRYPR